MGTRVRRRFWAESGLSCVVGLLAVFTALWPDWIEAVTGTNPDGGNGSLEWMIVLGGAAVSIAVALIARREWRRPRVALP